MSELKANKISPSAGTDLTLGDSGDTVTIPAGVTLAGNIPAANLTGALPAISGAALTGVGFRTGIHVWKNAGQTVANSTTTKVTYTEEFYDPNSDWDVSTSKFTAPEDGKYLITAGVRFSSGTNGYMTHLYFYVNGAAKTYSDNTSGNGTGINTTHTHILELSTDDYVEVYGDHNQGSSMIFEADSSTGFKFNYLAIQRIA
jgi:hypothetical protein